MIKNYAALASFYDQLMAHVEYDDWSAYIKKILDTYCSSPEPFIIEIGGGTGRLGEKLVEKGMNYQGSDFSFAMCKQARNRGVKFFAADARFFPVKKQIYDMAIFLYDGINYLQSIQEYFVTFENIHACLKSGGLFLFDITTQYNSITNFNEFNDTDDLGDYFYFRHSYYDMAEAIQYNDFTIFTKQTNPDASDDLMPVFYKYNEHHAQKVPPVAAIKKAIPEKLFDIIGIWEGFSFKRHSSRSVRVHFLLRKKSA
jgi:predicted TPR repeat methyltransferase